MSYSFVITDLYKDPLLLNNNNTFAEEGSIDKKWALTVEYIA